jgi:hypothetical protein
MIYSKISDERVVLMEAWRTHERQRVGGSQRSEGHGYTPKPSIFTNFNHTYFRLFLMTNYTQEYPKRIQHHAAYARLFPNPKALAIFVLGLHV